MIIYLPHEILYHIFLNFLSFFDTVNVKVLSKKFKKILDDNFYKEFGFNIYGKKFWEIANMRDPNISKPCKTSFEELRRIETFQNNQLKDIGKRCTNKEFYDLWVIMEPKLKYKLNII